MHLGLPVFAAYQSLREITAGCGRIIPSRRGDALDDGRRVVYDRIGLRILRRGRFNLDLGWSLVRIGSGAVTLFTSV